MSSSSQNSSYLCREEDIDILNDAFIIPSSPEPCNEVVRFTAPKTQSSSKKIKLGGQIKVNSRESKLGYDKKLKITFYSILCAKVFWEKFPQNNIWNNFKKDDGIALIINEILKTSTGVAIPAVDEDTLKNCVLLINALQKLVKNWRKCNIRYYLDKDCPSENETNVKTWKDLTSGNCFYERAFLIDAISAVPVVTTESASVIENIHESEIPHDITIDSNSPFSKAQNWKSVYRFLISIINCVIPLELFGSLHNKKCFKKAIKKFVTSGKHDVVLLESLMFGVKVTNCRWTERLETFSLKSKLLAQIWIWLLKTFVIDILRSFFYITEGNKCKNQLFFFRKKAFQGLKDSTCNKLLQLGSIKELTRKQYIEVVKTCRKSFGYQKLPRIRFIPKSSGLRPILPIKKGILTEQEIINAKQLAKFITDKFFPEIRTIRSDRDFQQSWVKYNESLVLKNLTLTFIVKVDIIDAFGSIKHDVLFNILTNVEKKLPALVKFDQFVNKDRNNKLLLLPSDGNYNNQKCLIKIGTIEINVKKTFENIKQLVKTQLFQMGVRQRFLIVKGIAQGGSLSSALCDIYYSAMSRKYLTNFTGNERIMMRSVDDFLYVTPSKTEAKGFLCFMEQGIDEFNCYINSAKTIHNLDNVRRVPYIGNVFCSASNQILVSVSSLTSCPPRYSIQLNRSSNSGKFIILKLLQILKSRFSKLITHPQIISISALAANIWRTGLNIGARLPCLIKILLIPERNFNSKFVAKNIEGLGKIIWSKLKTRWDDARRPVPLSRPFCITVFLEAIYLMLQNVKRAPPLKDLKNNIKKRTKKFLKKISAHESKFLPPTRIKKVSY